MNSLTDQDLELIEAARKVIQKLYRHRWHQLACAVRMRSGKVYTGVHVGLYVRRLSVCAESIAIGSALTEGEEGIESIVTVRMREKNIPYEDIRVVSPCGICREMISDYDKDAMVILETDGQLQKVPVAELIPHKYDKRND